jgi:hypothetical protein
MKYLYVLIVFAITSHSHASEPPRDIPQDHWSEFTWNGEIPVTYWYLNGVCDNTQPTVYTKETIDELVTKANLRETYYYGKTDEYVYKALSEFPITGKEVAIIGSNVP